MASGLIVGIVAINTVYRVNGDAATTQRDTIRVETAASTFSKNIEAFSGNLSAMRLYPSLHDRINQSIAADKQAVTDPRPACAAART